MSNKQDFFNTSLRQLDSLDDGLSGFLKLFQAVSDNLRLQIGSYAEHIERQPDVTSQGPGQLAGLVSQLSQAQVRIAELQPLADQAEALSEQQRHFERSEAKLKDELADLRKREIELRQAVKEQDQTESNDFKKEQTLLKEQLLRAQQDLTEAQAEHAKQLIERDERLHTLEKELQSLRENTDIDKDLAQMEQDFEAARSDGITAWDRVYELENELGELENALNSSQSDGITAWDRVYDLEEQNAVLEQKVVSLQEQANEIEDTSQLHQQLIESEDEIAALRARLDDAESMNKKFERELSSHESQKIASLEAQLVEVGVEKDMALRRLKKIMDRVKAASRSSSAEHTASVSTKTEPSDPESVIRTSPAKEEPSSDSAQPAFVAADSLPAQKKVSAFTETKVPMSQDRIGKIEALFNDEASSDTEKFE